MSQNHLTICFWVIFIDWLNQVSLNQTQCCGPEDTDRDCLCCMLNFPMDFGIWLFLVLGRDTSYFVKNNSESSSKYTEEDVLKMLEFFINNIFVQCGGCIFQQTVGIPVGTNCAPYLLSFSYTLIRLTL